MNTYTIIGKVREKHGKIYKYLCMKLEYAQKSKVLIDNQWRSIFLSRTEMELRWRYHGVVFYSK